MSDAIGAMRAYVTLQRPVLVADEIGGAAISWASMGSVWAAIEAGGANTSESFDTAASIASYTVIVNDRADIRVGWRMIWGARQFRIIGVSDDGAPRIVLHCEEERL